MKSVFSISPRDMMSETASELIFKTANGLAKQREQLLNNQLNDFISRGLITIKTEGPIFVQSSDQNTIEIRETVTLELLDKEYIQKLENELIELRELVTKMKGVFNG